MILSVFQKRFLASLIFIGIFFGASCLKKQDLFVDDLGAAASPEDVALSLGEAFGPINYNDMKPNEFSSIIVSQRLQDGPWQNVEQQDVTLLAIDNQPSYLQIQSRVLQTTFSSSGNLTDEREWNQYFQKYYGFAFLTNHDTHQNTGAQLTEPFFTFMFIQSLALTACDETSTYPEVCYGLSVQDIKYRVPSNSAHQHNCEDLLNCHVNAKKIEFDQLLKYKLDENGKPHRIHHMFIISNEVPFTARVLEYCTRSLYDLSGIEQKVMADVCYKVNKYSFGQ